MQKSQATAPLSTEENQIYERGYLAGFEAGQLASRDKSTQQNTVRANGQAFSPGAGNRRSQSQGTKNIETVRKTVEQHPNQIKKTIKTTPLADGFRTRKSLDNPTITRDIQSRKSVDEPTFTRGFQTRKSLDNPTTTRDIQSRKPAGETNMTRDDHIHNQEHEMAGKTTNPETEVQVNQRGQY